MKDDALLKNTQQDIMCGPVLESLDYSWVFWIKTYLSSNKMGVIIFKAAYNAEAKYVESRENDR